MRAAKTRATGLHRVLLPATRSALKVRLAALMAELEPSASPVPRTAGLEQLADVLPRLGTADLWLVLAVLHGEMPRATQVARLRRILELDTGWDAVVFLLSTLPRRMDPRDRPNPVVLSSGVTHVDVTGLLPGETDETPAEGRGVGRQLLREWSKAYNFLPITWEDNGRFWRGLTVEERELLRLPAVPGNDNTLAESVIVPRGGIYILLGTVDEPRAAERLIAFGQFGGTATGTVGYGLGPLLEPENYTQKTEGTARYSWHLASQRSCSVLVAIDERVAMQYRGWQRMLAAVGAAGPAITVVPLPTEPTDTGIITLPGHPNSDWQRFAVATADALQLA